MLAKPVVCYLLVATLAIFASAHGTTFLDQLLPNPPQTELLFEDDVYVPVGTIQTLQTHGFQLNKQFELSVQRPTININTRNDLSLAGSFGVNIRSSEGEVQITAGQQVSFEADVLDAHSNGDLNIISSGHIDITSSYSANFRGGEVLVLPTNSANLNSRGDIILSTPNRAGILTGGALNLSFGKDFVLRSNDDAGLHAGDNLAISGTQYGNFVGRQGVYFNSESALQMSATAAVLSKGSWTRIQALNNINLAGNGIDIIAFKDTLLRGDIFSLTGNSVTITAQGENAGVVIQSENDNDFTSGQSIALSAGDIGADIFFDAQNARFSSGRNFVIKSSASTVIEAIKDSQSYVKFSSGFSSLNLIANTGSGSVDTEDNFAFVAEGTAPINIFTPAGLGHIQFAAQIINAGASSQNSVFNAQNNLQFYSDVSHDIVGQSGNTINLNSRDWTVKGFNVIFNSDQGTVQASSVTTSTYSASPVGTRGCANLYAANIVPPQTCRFKTAFQITGNQNVNLASQTTVTLLTNIVEANAGRSVSFAATGGAARFSTSDSIDVTTRGAFFQGNTVRITAGTQLDLYATGGGPINPRDTEQFSAVNRIDISSGQTVHITGNRQDYISLNGDVSFGAAGNITLSEDDRNFQSASNIVWTSRVNSGAFAPGGPAYIAGYAFDAKSAINGSITGVFAQDAFFDVYSLNVDSNNKLNLIAYGPSTGLIDFVSGADLNVKSSTSSVTVKADSQITVTGNEQIYATAPTVKFHGDTQFVFNSVNETDFTSYQTLNISNSYKSNIDVSALKGLISFDASSALSLTAAANVQLNGGSFETYSAQNITAQAAGGRMLLTTWDGTSYGNEISFTARAINGLADLSVGFYGGRIQMTAQNVYMTSGANLHISAPSNLVTVDASVVSGTGTSNVNLQGETVVVRSGKDDDIYGSSGNLFTMLAAQNMLIYGEGNMTQWATKNFTITTTNSITLRGVEELHAHAEGRFQSVSKSTVQRSTLFSSGGALEVHSGAQNGDHYDVTIQSELDWRAAANREFRILSPGIGTDGCGVSIATSGTGDDFYKSDSILHIQAAQNVRVTSTDTQPGRSAGKITFRSSGSDYFHSQEGGVRMDVQGAVAGPAIWTHTTNRDGNIEIISTMANVFHSAWSGFYLSAGKEIALHGHHGVNVFALETDARIWLSAGGVVQVDGARGLNVSAGYDFPFEKGKLQLTARNGQIYWQSDDTIHIENTGPIDDATNCGGPCPAVYVASKKNDISLETRNSYEIQLAAFKDVRFIAQSNIIAESKSGDIDLTTNLGPLIATTIATDIDTYGSRGPVQFHAGGVSGNGEMKAKGWDMTAGNTLQLFARQGQFGFTAGRNVLFDSSGTAHFETAVRTGDISLGSLGAFSVTSLGTRETPEDRILIAGSAVDHVSLASITVSAGQYINIGENTDPLVTFNAGGTSSTYGFEARASGGIFLQSDTDIDVLSPRGSEWTAQNRLDSRSLGTVSISTVSNNGDDILFTAGKQASDQGSVKVGGALALHNTPSSTFVTSKFGVSLRTWGKDFNLDYILFTSGAETTLSSQANIIFTGSEIISAESDTTASFVARGPLLVRNVAHYGIQNDEDKGTIYLESDTSFLASAKGSITITTTNPSHAPINFLSKGNEAANNLIQLSTAGLTSPINILSWQRLALQGKTFSGSSTTKNVLLYAQNTASDSAGGLVDVNAGRNINIVSATQDITFSTGADLNFATTLPGSQVAFTSKLDLLISAYKGNLTIANTPNDDGSITFQGLTPASTLYFNKIYNSASAPSLQRNFVIKSDTSILVNNSPNKIGFFANKDFLETAGQWYYTNSNTLTFNAVPPTNQGLGNIVLRTQGVESDVLLTAGVLYAKSSLANINLVASDRVTLRGVNTLTLKAAAGPINVKSTQGNVEFLSTTTDIEVTASNTVSLTANGIDASLNFGIGIDSGSVGFNAKEFTTYARKNIAFVVENPKTAPTGLTVSTATGTVAFDASGVDAAITLQAPSVVFGEVTDSPITFSAGNNIDFLSTGQIDFSSGTQPTEVLAKTGDVIFETPRDNPNTIVIASAQQLDVLASRSVRIETWGSVAPLSFVAANNFLLSTASQSAFPMPDTTIRSEVGSTSIVSTVATTVTTDSLFITSDNQVLISSAQVVQYTSDTQLFEAGGDIEVHGPHAAIGTAAGGVGVVNIFANGHDGDIQFLANTATLNVQASNGNIKMVAKRDDGTIRIENAFDASAAGGLPASMTLTPLTTPRRITWAVGAAAQLTAVNGIQLIARNLQNNDYVSWTNNQVKPSTSTSPTAFVEGASLSIATYHDEKDILIQSDQNNVFLTAGTQIAHVPWHGTLGFFNARPKLIQWANPIHKETCHVYTSNVPNCASCQNIPGHTPCVCEPPVCQLAAAATEAEVLPAHNNARPPRQNAAHRGPSRCINANPMYTSLETHINNMENALISYGLINWKYPSTLF